MPEWMVRILKAAGKDNCPSAYGSFVQAWLEGIGAKPPAGMSIELQARGAPGRPRSDYTERVFACWVAIGQPSVYKSTLARAFYGKEFTTADAQQRKRLVDRCRRAVERRQPGAVASPE
jgi:hypothetical protein